MAEHAIVQIPVEHIETIDLLLRVDSAGASHKPQQPVAPVQRPEPHRHACEDGVVGMRLLE